MFAKILTADDWDGRLNRGVTVVNPTWQQVQQAINDLDGKKRTMVTLLNNDPSDQYMIIAGQFDQRWLVNATKNNYDFFSLVDSSRSDRKQILYVGGQDGEYPENKLVPMSWVLEVARFFFDNGELKSEMNWVSDY